MEEHKITQREMDQWQKSKGKKKRTRPELTTRQSITFLDLVAKMASQSTFDRVLGLNSNDVEFYKRKFDIESVREARVAAQRMEKELEKERQIRGVEETKKAKDAQDTASLRLAELNRKQLDEQPIKKVLSKEEKDSIKREDAARQKRLEESESLKCNEGELWRLDLGNIPADTLDQFRRHIVYHGLGFCSKMYGAKPAQIKNEAIRLGLKINWEVVRR